MRTLKLDQLIENAEAIESKATEGPFVAHERGSGISREYEIRTKTGGILFRSTSYWNMKGDSEFLAFSRQAIPALLAIVKTMEKALDKIDCECAGEGVEICYRCEALSKSDSIAAGVLK